MEEYVLDNEVGKDEIWVSYCQLIIFVKIKLSSSTRKEYLAASALSN